MLLEVLTDTRVGTLRCPSCGGEAKPDSVQCDWCGSSLATVSCPACFGAMFVGMKHCPWCGAAGFRENPAGPAAGLCPRCGLGMSSVKVGKILLSECRQCGGLWVDNSSFQQICQDREEQEAILGVAVPAADKPEINSPESGTGRMYVPCPVCATLMNRVNFAGCSGVVIDWCKEHGSWFDNNELRQIVTFIQRGGLKKSREREKERLQEEVRRLRHEESKLVAESIRLSHAPRLNWQENHNSLLDFLSAVWKGLAN